MELIQGGTGSSLSSSCKSKVVSDEFIEYSMLPVFIKTMTLIFKQLLIHFDALNAFYKSHVSSTEVEPIIKGSEVGHLLPLKCGHRGKPNRTEEKILEHLLNESGFL